MSKDNPKSDPHYQRRAKEIIDLMFNNKMINPEFSRDDMQELENYIAYVLQSGAESSAKVALVIERLKK